MTEARLAGLRSPARDGKRSRSGGAKIRGFSRRCEVETARVRLRAGRGGFVFIIGLRLFRKAARTPSMRRSLRVSNRRCAPKNVTRGVTAGRRQQR